MTPPTSPRRGRRPRPTPLPRSKDLGLSKIKIPPLPSPPPEADDTAGLPDDCKRIVACVRGPALVYVDRDSNIWGVGLGIKRVKGEKTGQYAVQFCVHRKLPKGRVPKGCMLPDSIDGVPVDVVEIGGNIMMAQRPCRAGNIEASGCAGARIDNQPPGAGGGGTFGGSWRRLDGSGQRGLTNAHVALGFGFLDFVAALPGSIGRLFQPPRGEEILTNLLGAANFRIMRIDTIWPILAPTTLTLPIAGALAFVYLDCAAGDMDYRAIAPPPQPPAPPVPPPLAARSGIVGGGTIESARPPLPGTDVYMIGAQTMFVFGEIILSFLQIPIAVGPIIIIFDQILCNLPIATGDSGAPLLTQSGNNYVGSCWGGLPLGGPPIDIGNDQIQVTHTLATPAHQIWWRMNLRLF